MRFSNFLIISVVIALASCTGKQKTEANASETSKEVSYTWTAEELPSLAVSGDEGVAAAMLTVVNGRLALGGGANFPDKPAAEGGKKHFYDSVYLLEDSSWVLSDIRLPQPLAHAATASVPEGLLVMGGNNGKSQVNDVFLWTSDGKFVSKIPLPIALDNAAAAYCNGYVYVFGGQRADGHGSRDAWRMAWPEADGWTSIAPLPMQARVQASASAMDSLIYIAGGFVPAYDTDGGVVVGSILAYNPNNDVWDFIDSQHKPGEVQTATLIGGTLLTCTQTRQLLFIGGVDANIFQQAITRPQRIESARKTNNKALQEQLQQEADEYMKQEPEWYNFNNLCYAYNLDNREFVPLLSHPSLARAGAAVLKRDDAIFVVGGELKPGIRANTALCVRRNRTTQ